MNGTTQTSEFLPRVFGLKINYLPSRGSVDMAPALLAIPQIALGERGGSMRVLVTGHNGYLGSVMVPVLQAAGHDVVGLDTFLFADCTLGVDRPPVPALNKDLRDVRPEDLEGVHALIHLAALSSDPGDELDPEVTYEINHRAAVHLARCARDAGVSRFLLASTCSVYGGAADHVLTEDAPLRPTTHYTAAKVRAEEDIARLADTRFSPAFMRAATCYGVSPRMRVDTILNDLVCTAHLTGRIRIPSDSTSWLPLVHVQDLACAFSAALAAPRHALHGQAFNVGADGENYQLSEIAALVSGAVPGCTIEHDPDNRPHLPSYRVDFQKLARACPDFSPQWNAAFGAKDLYATLQETGFTSEELRSRRFVRIAQLKYLRNSGLVDQWLRPFAIQTPDPPRAIHRFPAPDER